MFETLKAEREDPILALMMACRSDARAGKIDLGVGVYRDADGRTPVMRAVKAAEQRILERQETKSYLALTGDPAFSEAVRRLVLADTVPASRVAAAATPGGTGAVRLALDAVRRAAPDATVWLPDPTWPNHAAIADQAGLRRRTYRYYDAASGAVDLDGLLADLTELRRDDVVVLHGCCHNPTGADPDAAGWDAIAEAIGRAGAVPLVDLAYLGFGDGIDTDAAATRLLAGRLPVTLVAVSGSKSFGLYRDRAGTLLATTPTETVHDALQSVLSALNRAAYSFPPDHPGRVVTEILTVPLLEAEWRDELEAMRVRIVRLRGLLAAELRRATNSECFDSLVRQKGMFSRLPLPPEMVAALRERDAIYMVGDGRINLAGLSEAGVAPLAAAVANAVAARF